MISNLIQPPNINKEVVSANSSQTTSTSVQNCARLLVNGMGEAQRGRFRTMLQHGVECGRCYAQSYGVPLNEFMEEVQKII